MRSLKLLMAIFLAVMLVAPMLLSACDGGSDEIFELSISPAYPGPEEPLVEWIEYIEEETDGRVIITSYYGLHDPMNSLAELQAGVCDIGMTPVGVQPGLVIANAMDSFSYGYPAGEELNIAWELWDDCPEWSGEYASVKPVLWVGGVTSMYIMTNEPITTIDDIEGLILRGLSFHIEPFQRMGAEVVTIPATETYTAVEKGTVDGCILPASFFESYSLNEVVSYATPLYISPMAFPGYCMNLDVWNSLPSDIQDVFEDSMEYWSQVWVDWSAAGDYSGLELAEASGIEILEFSEEELAKVHGYYEEVALEVAADLDAQGIPGTEILEAMRDIIDQYS